MQTQLDTETAAFDLTSEQTVLEYTQSSADPVLCRAVLAIGDVSKPLDGSGGAFTISITVDDVPVYPYPATVTFAALTAVGWESDGFTVPEDAEIDVLLTSPNGADTDVNVAAVLYGTDVSADYETFTQHLSGAVGICNQALGLLGDVSEGKRLITFTRAGCSTPAQHACLDFFDESKHQMLAMKEWARAQKTLALTVSADAPILSDAYTVKYARPADALIFRRVVDTGGNEYEFETMNELRSGTVYNDEFIYTNLDDALGVYTFSVGEERYNVGMAGLHSMLLAEMVSMTVVADEKKALLVTQRLHGYKDRLFKEFGAAEGYIKDRKGSANVTEVF